MAPQASSKRSAIANKKHRRGRKRSAVTNLCHHGIVTYSNHGSVTPFNHQKNQLSHLPVRELMDQFNEEGPRAEIYVKRTINGMIGDDYLAETTNADGEKTVSPTQKLDQLLDDIEASTEFQELLAIASEEERYIQTCLFFKSRLTVQRRTLSQLHELWMTERRLREEYESRFGVLQPRENKAVQTEPNERDIAVGPTVHAAPPNTSASHGANYDETMEDVPMNGLNNATYHAHGNATVGTSSNQPAIPVTPMRPNAHGTTPFPYPSPKSMPRARRRLATPIPQTDPDDDNEYEDDGIYMDVDERPDPGPSSVGGDRSTSRTPARDDVEARLQAAMADKTEEIRRKDLQITQKDALLTQKDMQLAQKDTQLAQRDAQVTQKDRQLVELDNSLFERDNMLAQRNVDVALLQGQVTASRDRLERQLEENEVEQMILLRTIEKEQDEKEQLKQRYKEEIRGIQQAMNDQLSLALHHLQSGL
ncbi:hypothetical protein FISHEDRAFT_55233 [Fistulina hepatica ATCC 64428]|uniref:Uncharacterized protein n=1 Tax=Fistulina hepatica ATCC 64428 TaxID=1128425 RepID=A0A0D7APX7_9AGAR|nr:hypothetical protein FISHEDRAFT_55233 [Fistulina hepatica ATCC 64428]